MHPIYYHLPSHSLGFDLKTPTVGAAESKDRKQSRILGFIDIAVEAYDEQHVSNVPDGNTPELVSVTRK